VPDLISFGILSVITGLVLGAMDVGSLSLSKNCDAPRLSVFAVCQEPAVNERRAFSHLIYQAFWLDIIIGQVVCPILYNSMPEP
jgi:hypothetical protein